MLALAPDDSARRAAATLNRPAPWGGTGATDALVWGLCAGSGKNPYQVIVDLGGPAFKCSCPSRKFPCKHALGLLLLWSAGTVPDQSEPSDYARGWQEARKEKAEKSKPRSPAGTGVADSPAKADSGSADDGLAEPGVAGPVKDEAAAARRAAERAKRVTGGLADLREWLRDQVRVGLASAAVAPSAGNAVTGRPGPAGQAELMAARMIDVQAPGVAAALRGLAAMAHTAGGTLGAAGPAGISAPGQAASDSWPGRLLAEYAMLHLLARAHERLDALPDGLAAVVRSRVGYPVSRQEVLARPAVTGHWLVVAVRDLADGQVPGRRIWLRDAGTGQWAMLLTFAAPNGAWQDPETARLRPGTEVHADLHYYPGQPPLRGLLGERHGDPLAAKPPALADGIDGMLAECAASLAHDPWLTYWPALLTGTPVPPGQPVRSRRDTEPGRPADGGTAAGTLTWHRWHLIDEAGNALALADRDSLWMLLAVSGGHPVTVAGEWHLDGLTALTTWHGDQAVPL